MSRRSVVGIATMLSTKRSGVRIPVGKKNLFPKNVQIGSGAHPASYAIGNGVLSRG